MNSDEFANLQDGQDLFIETVKGFKEKMMAAGFSELIAEEAALQFLMMIVAGTTKG